MNQTARPEPRPAGGEGRRRATIERVSPEVDGGRFAVKRIVGDEVVVEADCFADGHDLLAALVRYRHVDTPEWHELPMEALGDDRWRAAFRVDRVGRYRYAVEAWVDRFRSWRRDLGARLQAGQEIGLELLVGADLVEAAAERAGRAGATEDALRLRAWAAALRAPGDEADGGRAATGRELADLMAAHPDRGLATRYDRELEVVVEPEGARFGAWYEMFPRSAAPVPGRHGSLRDVIARLPYVASMGFDVLYLPPIHPIGRTARKGPNNDPRGGADVPGSPWAIGGPEGGHTAVHPELGTLDDVRALVDAARERGISVALDLAFQCSPDHPAVREHPEWFRWRPDGSARYAENPPKRYEDIYPFDFESDAWESLWAYLRDVVRFWIAQGIRIFRVDNPHTKPFAFWEWLIGEVKRNDPDVIFLAEAFTRPRVMYRLAKLGFSQSYTYFTWRNTKRELTDYLTELTRGPVREFFRPSFWPNTPDILHEELQHGGTPAFQARLVLAATLASSYGIYGPAYELCEARALRPDSEEYLDSEKYQVRHWQIGRPESLSGFIGQVNRARREHAALQSNERLVFHPVDNERLLAYTKQSADGDDLVLVVVNLDYFHAQAGWLELPLAELGVDPRLPYEVHDLLGGRTEVWHGARNYVELDPAQQPASILHVRGRVRTETDYDYYL